MTKLTDPPKHRLHFPWQSAAQPIPDSRAPDGAAAGDLGEPPEPHEPFQPEFLRRLESDVLTPMAERYFRATIVGGERIPANGPAILAANHSGNAFPWDGIILDTMLWRRDGMRYETKVRSVYEPELSFTWWMRPFGIDDLWRRGGGVDMTFDNFDRLLARGDRVLYFPEGVPGIGKGFHNRYRLQPFKTSFVLLAARHRTPVLPLYVINGEWLHPFGYTWGPVDRVFQRVFGVPFLPLPLGLLAIAWPWIWFFVFPAKLTFVVGEPLDIDGALAAEGITDLEQPERSALRRAGERLRRHMQGELEVLVRRYGRERYDWRSFWRALRPGTGRGLRLLPCCWPFIFVKNVRDQRRAPARSRLHAILRDWDLALFLVPLGWPLLTLARRLRRPPLGFRGLSRTETRRREGAYVWRLAERPLPPRSDRNER